MTRRVSPDTVAVIDLTADDDDDDDGVVDVDRFRELNGVRKRLKRSFSHRVKRETTTELSAPSLGGEVTRSSRKSGGTSAEVKPEPSGDAPEDDGGGKIGEVRGSKRQRRGNDTTALATGTDSTQEGDDEDCLVVAPPSRAMMPSAAAASKNSNDDVVLMGTVGESRLPHMRQHCTECKFSASTLMNKKFCDLCYCYICDEKCTDCKSWTVHCNATDVGPSAHRWRARRDEAKRAKQAQRAAASVTANSPSTSRAVFRRHDFRRTIEKTRPSSGNSHNTPSTATSTASVHVGGQRVMTGAGPFPPNHAVAAQDKNLTKCRKCGWYNRFFHRNFRHHKELHPVGFLDWCHKCGRVASEKDFDKAQSKPYKRVDGDVFLGERVIEFRIVAHDPRKMDRFKNNWSSSSGPEWTYNEAELREDVFRHRFGKKPTFEMVVASIPIGNKENDMPSTGSFSMDYYVKNSIYQKQLSEREMVKEAVYKNRCCPQGDKFAYWYDRSSSAFGPTQFSVDEAEGIILQNPADLLLLQELGAFECEKKNSGVLGCDIDASWDRDSESGSFMVRLYLQPSKNQPKGHDASFSRLLSAWYNLSPIRLTDICGTLKAEASESKASTFSDSDEDSTSSDREAIALSVETINVAAQANQDKQSLVSSQKNAVLGGVSELDQDFPQVIERFFRQTLVEDIMSSFETTAGNGRGNKGTISSHRSLRRRGTPLLRMEQRDNAKSPYHLCGVSHLRSEDQPLAVVNLRDAASSVYYRTQSLQGIIAHCENLGHSEITSVEGLTVELLPFQRQSVQWALERETVQGGIQSLLWPKLPHVEEPGKDVYFNPVIESFRTDKPRIVKGGIIAEEMGLGKTVISLALILQNPPPKWWPVSCSPVSKLDRIDRNAPGRDSWDSDLYARTSTHNPKRGSIISHGTLVVCPVSLVGQWIDEAKSKLSNPGLIYSYHGQGRKRDPMVLASNSIVVTTYETLASDATYHKDQYEKKQKKDSEPYIAPLEQVRWHRIICDESHGLRDAGTQKGKALMDLVADHKWLVTGTPISTTLVDLKNQLEWLGLENVNEMFGCFKRLLAHTNDPSAGAGQGRRGRRHKISKGRIFGHFTFLMRAVMMRHDQNQSYAGTSNTLMSLPPKTERTVEVEFTDKEKEQYSDLQKSALDFYSNFKKSHHHNLGKHFLLLSTKLMPLRVSCAGGHFPLDAENQKEQSDSGEQAEEHGDTLETEDEDEAAKDNQEKKHKVVQYSDFAFTSKFTKLIEELKHARDNDPSSKSLVFSQFTSSLQYLQGELPKHGFQFRTISGDMSMKKRAKALHDFQNDPPTTIFLLSMRAGACGINLTQANRVFLLEPCFNPALEKQSIGRVHRLGQKRNVEIVRLVMKDSVETRMQKMLSAKFASADSNTNLTKNVMVGSVATDKAKILGKEFDMLFGLADSCEGPPPLEAVENADEVKPEAVFSLGSNKKAGSEGQSAIL